jgi:3-oxoacyl-[acyl-carrier protein] reductase
MNLGIKDRGALVATASKGLGFAAARELALEGARVLLCSRDQQRAAEAAQRSTKRQEPQLQALALM